MQRATKVGHVQQEKNDEVIMLFLLFLIYKAYYFFLLKISTALDHFLLKPLPAVEPVDDPPTEAIPTPIMEIYAFFLD